MALGGIILYLQQNLLGDAVVADPALLNASDAFTIEFRVKFPTTANDEMQPVHLSASLVTLSTGSIDSSYMSIWYAKDSLSSHTGTIFLTSSAGLLAVGPYGFFDDNFHNISLVKERATGSIALSVMRHENGALVYSTSSYALSGSSGYPHDSRYETVELGSSHWNESLGEFWGQEFRLWNDSILPEELEGHSAHFESYGREISYENKDLLIHWRFSDASTADGDGQVFLMDSTPNRVMGTGSNFAEGDFPFTKFLFDYGYIPSIDYGWNQEKVRTLSGSNIDPRDAYIDEKFVSLEFNMYDALNEDISHVMTSYDELNNFIGLPINKYREDYEGLRQMRETYFKRLQGELNFRVFTDMLDFFDSSFVSVVERLIPARALFKGDELVVESHMLERPKYQYQLRPVVEGMIEIGGSISVVDYGDDE